MLGFLMYIICACITYTFVAAGLNLNRDCNEPILQMVNDNTMTSKLINQNQKSLHLIIPDSTISLPYLNANTFATFSNENNHQTSVQFSQFERQTPPRERLVLTGIKIIKLVGLIGPDESNCGDFSNNQNISAKIFYKIGNTVKEIEFISVEGEEGTFSTYEKRRFMPLIAEEITVAIARRDEMQVCAQFELYGCAVKKDSIEGIELSEVIENIFPSPDKFAADSYTGECLQGKCYGGVGLLTDKKKDTCSEWYRQGANINSTLSLWFTLDSNEDLHEVILYGESDVVSNAPKFTVGIGLGGREMEYRVKEVSANSIGTYRIAITTLEYFSVQSVASAYVLINITSPDPGTFKLCETEIYNQLGVRTPNHCTIDASANKLTCSDSTRDITYKSSVRVNVLQRSEQLSNGGLNNGRDQLATPAILVTTNNINTITAALAEATNATSISSPMTTPHTTPTVQVTTNSTSSTQEGTELFIYIGVGAAGVIIMILVTIFSVVIGVLLVRKYSGTVKVSNERTTEFPLSSCVIYGKKEQRRPNEQFVETILENKIVIVGTSEGMSQVPNMPVNIVYKVLRDRPAQFSSNLSPGNGEGVSSGVSTTLAEMTDDTEIHIYEEVVCDAPLWSEMETLNNEK